MKNYDAYAEASRAARYGMVEDIQYRVDSIDGPVSIDEAFSGSHRDIYITVPGLERPFVEHLVMVPDTEGELVLKQGRLIATGWDDIRGSVKETKDMWQSLEGNDDLIEVRGCLVGFGYMESEY